MELGDQVVYDPGLPWILLPNLVEHIISGYQPAGCQTKPSFLVSSYCRRTSSANARLYSIGFAESILPCAILALDFR